MKIMGKLQNETLTYGDSLPNLADVAVIGCLMYGNTRVVILKEKYQYGADKRVFFIQLSASRHQNKLIEDFTVKILRNIDVDMIGEAGDLKLISIGKMLTLFKKGPHTIWSVDQTKYGDMYPMHAITAFNNGFFKAGIYDRREFEFIAYTHMVLRHRIVMAPRKLIDLAYHVKNTNSKIMQNDKIKSLVESLTAGTDAKIKDQLLYFADDVAFIKEIGMILGALNFQSSIGGAAAVRMANRFIREELWKDITLDGKTHSDDVIAIVNLPVPNKETFQILHLKDGIPIEVADEVKSKISFLIYYICLAAIGQRMSDKKTGIGTKGEVLQVWYNPDPLVPLLRYTTSLMKDMPGRSPGSDMNSASGRIWAMINHDSGSVLAAASLLAMNMTVRIKYGMSDFPLRGDLHPNIGGIWYACPTEISSVGFIAQDLRLTRLAEHDIKIKNMLKGLLNAKENWVQRGSIYDNVNNDLSFDVTDETEENEPEGLVTGFKDIRLIYTRKKKTLASYHVLKTLFLERIKTDLFKGFYRKRRNLKRKFKEVTLKTTDEEAEELIAKLTDKDILKIAEDYYLTDILTGPKQLPAALTQVLTRYHQATFIESFGRINPGLRIINQLGYPNRQILAGRKELHKMTIKDFWKLAEEGIDTEDNERLYQLYLNMFENSINDLKGSQMMVREIIPSRDKVLLAPKMPLHIYDSSNNLIKPKPFKKNYVFAAKKVLDTVHPIIARSAVAAVIEILDEPNIQELGQAIYKVEDTLGIMKLIRPKDQSDAVFLANKLRKSLENSHVNIKTIINNREQIVRQLSHRIRQTVFSSRGSGGFTSQLATTQFSRHSYAKLTDAALPFSMVQQRNKYYRLTARDIYLLSISDFHKVTRGKQSFNMFQLLNSEIEESAKTRSDSKGLIDRLIVKQLRTTSEHFFLDKIKIKQSEMENIKEITKISSLDNINCYKFVVKYRVDRSITLVIFREKKTYLFRYILSWPSDKFELDLAQNLVYRLSDYKRSHIDNVTELFGVPRYNNELGINKFENVRKLYFITKFGVLYKTKFNIYISPITASTASTYVGSYDFNDINNFIIRKIDKDQPEVKSLFKELLTESLERGLPLSINYTASDLLAYSFLRIEPGKVHLPAFENLFVWNEKWENLFTKEELVSSGLLLRNLKVRMTTTKEFNVEDLMKNIRPYLKYIERTSDVSEVIKQEDYTEFKEYLRKYTFRNEALQDMIIDLENKFDLLGDELTEEFLKEQAVKNKTEEEENTNEKEEKKSDKKDKGKERED
jgi:hypothetical protein